MPPEVTTAPAAAPAEAPAAAPAQAPAAAPAAQTLFTTPPAAPAPPADGVAVEAPDWLPEKYRVMDAEGKLDLTASSQKLAEGYTHAQKRIGTGDLPPEKPDGYKDTPPPEAFKDVPLDPELTRSFRERAHKAGLTQSQLDFVMGEYFTVVPSMLNAKAGATADEARAELSKVWGTPAEMQSNMTAAERAVAAVPPGLQEQIRTEFGTNPLFWQFAAQFGKEVGEDKSINGGGAQPVADTDALMRTDAYRNAKHPDHAKVSAQVREAFEKRHGTAPAMA